LSTPWYITKPVECQAVIFKNVYITGKPKKTNLKKQETLEIAFQIYPPKGTAIPSNRQSTWMTPIIDGQEATKLMGE